MTDDLPTRLSANKPIPGDAGRTRPPSAEELEAADRIEGRERAIAQLREALSDAKAWIEECYHTWSPTGPYRIIDAEAARMTPIIAALAAAPVPPSEPRAGLGRKEAGGDVAALMTEARRATGLVFSNPYPRVSAEKAAQLERAETEAWAALTDALSTPSPAFTEAQIEAAARTLAERNLRRRGHTPESLSNKVAGTDATHWERSLEMIARALEDDARAALLAALEAAK